MHTELKVTRRRVMEERPVGVYESLCWAEYLMRKRLWSWGVRNETQVVHGHKRRRDTPHLPAFKDEIG